MTRNLLMVTGAIAAISLVAAACDSSDSGGVEPSASAVVVEPSASAVVVEPSASAVVVEPSASAVVVEPSAGVALLPDLVPAAPVDIHTINEDGVDLLRFTSTLVNVGTGDFLLHGTRSGPDGDDWAVRQEIPRSSGEADVVPTEAVMAWGGDGHLHWHVARVADYRLVKIDDEGNEVDDFEAQVDTKVGFCFYDSGRQLERIGPEEAVYSHETCGGEDDTEFAVGLSIGWGDTYHWLLPGQAFDITDVPDGSYRLWAQADGSGWFQEANRDNNVTWVDLELSTLPEGYRGALISDVGPEPE